MRTVRKRLEGKWGEAPRQECAPDQGLRPGQQEGLQPEPWESLEAAQDGPLLEGHGWIARAVDAGSLQTSPEGGRGRWLHAHILFCLPFSFLPGWLTLFSLYFSFCKEPPLGLSFLWDV